MLAPLLNDLESTAVELLVVLDDYHVIEAPEIHEGLSHLVEHLPPQVHLVVATRADPRCRSRGCGPAESSSNPRHTPALHPRRSRAYLADRWG